MNTAFLSVVIPAYNEADNILSTLEELVRTIGQCPAIREHEIIVVDDHSSDQTFQLVQSLQRKNIHCIRLSRRSGSHTALRAGISMVKGDWTLCISADGQEDPRVFNDMFEKIRNGAHAVWGVRKQRNEPWISKLFAAIAYKIIIAFSDNPSSNIDLSHANFFLISRKIVDAVNVCAERNTSLWGLICWVGYKQDFVEYDRQARRSGKSKWSFRNRVRLFKDWVIAFSGAPLKLMSWVGAATATIGFAYAIFIVIYSLLGYSKPGWAETVILILVLGGIQMTMLGLVGEYLWRTLDESRRRPLFFIENRS